MAQKLTGTEVKEFHDDEYVQLQDEFEQIRTCIGMYISYRGTKAALHLFKEIFNNSLDDVLTKILPQTRSKSFIRKISMRLLSLIMVVVFLWRF